MKRKLISIMLVMAMSTALLAGCGGGSSSGASGGGAEDAAVEADAGTSGAEETQEAAGAAEETAASETEAAGAGETGAAAVEADAAATKADATAAEAGTEIAAAEDAETAAEEEIDLTSGTPWICSTLDGAVTADTQANLKDDFYLAVNKDAIAQMEIPDGYSSAGTMFDVMMQSDQDIKNLFTSGVAAESHDAQLALNLYSLFMDWDGRNAAGIAPLKEMVDKVEQVDSIDGLMAYYSETPLEDVLYSPYVVDQMEGLDDSSKYVLVVDANGLLMEDSGEYAALTDYGRSRKEASHTMAVKMLCKMGYTEEEAEKKFENCLAFETAIAPSVYTMQESQESDYYDKINNSYTRDELQEAEGKLPIITSAENQCGYPQIESLLVFQPKWLAGLNELLTEENLDLLKDYTIVHGVINKASFLDRECYEWSNDYNNTITGSKGIFEDDLAMSQRVSDTLSWPVARLYSETYLKQEDKDRINLLIDEVIEEYHGIINEADFLSDETKAIAIEKLETMGRKVLWPDDWSPYSCDNLEIASAADGGSLWEALKAVSVDDRQKDVELYSAPVDKSRWPIPPTVFNCFYNPSANDITILGCFARGTIYHSDMTDEELLGTVGMVVGHEVSHAFDINGSQFDKDGNLASWWTDEDRAAFVEKDKKLQEYYNAIQPWSGTHFKGSIVTGEACADMGGVKCALRIASGMEGFDYDKFFKTYAVLWMGKDSYNRALKLLNDPHPMNYLRINCVLQQYDEFLDQYDIQEGDGMYLAPEDRVNIW